MPAGFDERTERFCQLVATGSKIRKAYADAGFAPSSANASRLHGKPEVQARIDEILGAGAAKAEITAEKILRRLAEIAFADPNDIVQFRRTACRYCYGVEHAYRWIDVEEFNQALSVATAKKAKILPTNKGGFGFDHTVVPHPECPRCNGEGHGDVHALDTRRLSGAAKALYAGAKRGRDGLEIKTHDQMKALEMLARATGLFKDDEAAKGAGVTININGPAANL